MQKEKYQKLIQILFSMRGSTRKVGLHRMLKVSKIMGSHQNKYPTIHIAGTNGKGSVATKIATALSLSGYKVGLYTSPHIHTFCERIKVNNLMISKEEVVDGICRIFELNKKHDLHLTFFEITTLLAFEYFEKNNVDIAVIETGLGGRYDATNIITPILSIITSIGYDHMDILGNSLDLIANEKAQIIKPDIPVILGPTANRKVILDYAKQNKSPIESLSSIAGFFDFENRQMAKLALTKIQDKFSLKEVSFASLDERPECRYEALSSNHKVIFDVAHNPQGFKRLFEQIKNDYREEDIHILFSMCKDKDLTHSLSAIEKERSFFYLFDENCDRLIDANVLQKILQDLSFENILLFSSLEKAIDQAYIRSERNGVLLVCGSFYIMDRAKTLIKKKTDQTILV